jgi:hypothetical protein
LIDLDCEEVHEAVRIGGAEGAGPLLVVEQYRERGSQPYRLSDSMASLLGPIWKPNRSMYGKSRFWFGRRQLTYVTRLALWAGSLGQPEIYGAIFRVMSWHLRRSAMLNQRFPVTLDAWPGR